MKAILFQYGTIDAFRCNEKIVSATKTQANDLALRTHYTQRTILLYVPDLKVAGKEATEELSIKTHVD